MGAGSTDISSGELTLRQTIILAAGDVAFSDELAVLGLPSLGYWVTFTAGAGPVAVVPQFAIREITGGVAPIREYLSFQNGTPLILGTPILFPFHFPASFIRLRIENTGLNAATLEIALGASI